MRLIKGRGTAGSKRLPVLLEEPDEVRAALSGLHRLIYTSEARSPCGGRDAAPTEIVEVIAAAASRNRALGLSGVLIAVQGHFIQILEGQSSSLETVFESICRDTRHRALSLIDFSPALERMFEQWSMVPLDARTVRDPELYEDLFTSILAGMAPAAIVQDVRLFLDDHLAHAARGAAASRAAG